MENLILIVFLVNLRGFKNFQINQKANAFVDLANMMIHFYKNVINAIIVVKNVMDHEKIIVYSVNTNGFQIVKI